MHERSHLPTTGRLASALELRRAIELFQSRWQKPPTDPDHRDLTRDFLNAADWIELERFHEFLKPFYILTRTMEGNAGKLGEEGGHGAVWETLKTMDYLFMKFKQAAEMTRLEEASHFKPVYRAALALHPSYGYDYFERHRKKAMNKPDWYCDMRLAVGNLFDEYRRQVEAEAQAGFLDDDSEKADTDNEYSSFGKRSMSSLSSQRKKVKATLLNGGISIDWNIRSCIEWRWICSLFQA
ncbi:transposase-like protein [Hirsutella rhossiliensis]|uniref:Transposase-like protein n=1 Tax=Hirsutella rhossiliensis TaxID=111463 RepID=A0A9P8N8N8_9HYPO|nr:transposase-like protein [Hirsutella rhossiliensis]KAH0968572.1 transposase-like protein [Hirsutella rhossiliensis]